ncbi:MAG: hypothetical protein WBA07_02980 [Rivularia sp. (in: cyanobacteria)]
MPNWQQYLIQTINYDKVFLKLWLLALQTSKLKNIQLPHCVNVVCLLGYASCWLEMYSEQDACTTIVLDKLFFWKLLSVLEA